MNKKWLTVLLTVIMMLSGVTGVGAVDLALDYWPGESEYVVDMDDYIETDGSSLTEDGVKISQGGSATFGFYVPYNTRSVTISSMGMAGITFDTGDNQYKLMLSGEGTDTLIFGENLGREPQKYGYNHLDYSHATREHIEHRGEKLITITADAEITIYSLTFEKEKTVKLIRNILPNVSNETMVTMSTVFMDVDSPAIVVNGSTRYIDYDNPALKPLEVDGSLYLPIDTLAKALGYYWEEDPEKNYVLMRSGTHEFVMLGDSCTVSNGLSERGPASSKAIIYRDGETLAAVRYFAELNGETVGYQNGLVVIDNVYTVADILDSSNSLNSYAHGLFKAFKSAKVGGKTYYVAQNGGSDDNVGNAAAPFKTITKAANVAAAGDTVIIKEGTYRETLTPKNSGTATSPITFKAADGEKVVISAAEKLGTLAHYKDNIYVAAMPTDLGVGRNQVFIDGKMQTEARYPNGPGVGFNEDMLDEAWATRGNLYRPVGSPDKVESDTLLNQPENYWAGGYYVGLFGHGYTQQTAKIKSSKPGELTLAVTPGTEVAKFFFSTQTENKYYNWGYIVGHEKALDIPGEWIRTEDQDGTLNIILPEGKNPDDVNLEVKARQLVIDLANKNYVNIDGIETFGGGARMNNSKMCMLNNMDMKYISHFTYNADSRDGYIDFPYNLNDTNGAPQRGEVGIYISGSDNIVANSVIDHSAGCAVYLVGTYSQIDNNVMKDCGYMGTYVSGIHLDTVASDSATKPRGGFGIYNNTVFNCGRSAFNGSTLESGSLMNAVWLPSEIAYNDFHDAMLTSADTGIVYAYGNTYGWDYQMSEFHHNYVYQTISAEDYNPYSMGIYLDGGSAGIDTYDNVIFHTGTGKGFSEGCQYEQSYAEFPASHRVWGNNKIGYVFEDVDKLQPAYFTEDKAFFAGSSMTVDDYTTNYDRFSNNRYGMAGNTRNAELSEGVTLDAESGYAIFSGNDQYIKFKNVDFGEGSNELSICYRGDSGYTYDKLEIQIDNISYNVTILSGARDLDQSETERIAINETSGTHDVIVKVKDYRSVSIGGITPYVHGNNRKTDDYSYFTFASEYTDIETFADNPNSSVFARRVNSTVSWASYAIKDTWPGKTLVYEDQVIEEDSSHLAIAISSSGRYGNQPIEICLDEKLVLRTDKTRPTINWNDYEHVIYTLNEPVKAGTYDIRVKFAIGVDETGVEMLNKSSNFESFGFIKVGADLSRFAIPSRTYGGEFNAEESVQSSTHSFTTIYMDPPQYYHKGLMYTYNGTTAGYSGVQLVESAKTMRVRYATEAENDGQTVEVRVGSMDSTPVATFVTEGTGSTNFNTYTLDLSDEIAPGTYDVFLTFKGEEKDQTCQLAWFEFR